MPEDKKPDPAQFEPECTGEMDSTRLAHDDRYDFGAVAPPIHQTSLFTFRRYADFLARYRGDSDDPVYSRVDNPTVRVFEQKLALLERADGAVAFGSGMAAISGAILSVARAGDRVVCIKHVYPDTYRFLRGLCDGFGISADFVDGRDPGAIEAALPGAKLLYLESPNSWVMQEQHLSALAELARRHRVATIIDNTWATPLFQKPLTVGIDIVVHSATKYLSGHSDIVAGVAAGSAEHIARIRQTVSPYLGAKLSAHEAAMLVRGLRTLPLRMQRHHASGLLLAERLAAHPDVRGVNHPGLSPVGHSQLSGYGGLFSIEVGEDIDIPTLCDSLSLFRLGVSWGGYESLVIPAAIALQQNAGPNPARDFGVSPRLLRLFVGLENPDDLWTDLEGALARAREGTAPESSTQ